MARSRQALRRVLSTGPQSSIVAEDAAPRTAVLDRLPPLQREDFAGIFRAMDGFPVTQRRDSVAVRGLEIGGVFGQGVRALAPFSGQLDVQGG